MSMRYVIEKLKDFKVKVNGNSRLVTGDLDAWRYTKHEIINEAIRLIEEKIK